jgi:hypothetical protein
VPEQKEKPQEDRDPKKTFTLFGSLLEVVVDKI